MGKKHPEMVHAAADQRLEAYKQAASESAAQRARFADMRPTTLDNTIHGVQWALRQENKDVALEWAKRQMWGYQAQAKWKLQMGDKTAGNHAMKQASVWSEAYQVLKGERPDLVRLIKPPEE